MRHPWIALPALLMVFLTWTGPLRPAEKAQETLVDQVKQAIANGVQFLKNKQVVKGPVDRPEDQKGNWEIDPVSVTRPGGETCLALLALLNSGVPPDDPAIKRGLNYIRDIEPLDTYVVGLQTMVFALAGYTEDRERMQRNVDWLVESWNRNGKQGWSYRKIGAGTDNSNTQYAVLGLHEAHQAGARIDPEVWQSIRKYYMDCQRADGAWSYLPNNKENDARLTMTTAGLCGLLIAGKELAGRERIQPDGTVVDCGVYDEDKAILKALDWIGKHYTREAEFQNYKIVYYNLYGIERAGRLSGRRFLGDHDWYRDGCAYLVPKQKDDGSWIDQGNFDQWPAVSTSFALLFLSKGRTPVLISKLVHGAGEDWNNDRHDARHLTEYASRELFKKHPLAWQVFEGKRGLGEGKREELLQVTRDLLQTPIAYFNGHKAPNFTPQEESLLQEYVEQGGFIMAEACCGRPEFDKGFRDLMARLFRDTPLRKLPPEHPIFHAHFPITNLDQVELYGIERGCKTVVVYSPRDLSCWWESNQFDNDRGGKQAFQLGANIIAYATGMELPKPRLTEVEIITDKSEEKKVPRGFLKVVQLRHDGDWQPAPNAMRNLMLFLKERPRLDVAVQTEALNPSNPNLLEFKFLYMHGRGAFTYTRNGQDKDNAALANLRSDLNTGGLLLADACCGKKEFDQSFREFAAQLYPDKKLEPIPVTDELYGKELNGEAIATVRCRRESPDGKGAEVEMHEVPPFLEGIKINGRWVVIYSKYDLGCALEKHQSTDCLGHDYPSALKLAAAAVYYAMKR